MGDVELTLSELIADLIARNGWTQKEYGQMVGASQSAVSGWTSGKQPPQKRYWGRIASTLDMTKTEVGSRINRSPWQNRDLERSDAREARLSGETTPFVVVGVLPADALRGIFQEGDFGTVDVPLAWLAGRSPDDFEVSRVSGDCMLALGIGDGAYVLWEYAKGRRPNDGDDVVVRIGDDYTLKRWYWRGPEIELQDGDGNVVFRGTPADNFNLEGFVVTSFRHHRDVVGA